jgi:hypothetical protein
MVVRLSNLIKKKTKKMVFFISVYKNQLNFSSMKQKERITIELISLVKKK